MTLQKLLNDINKAKPGNTYEEITIKEWINEVEERAYDQIKEYDDERKLVRINEAELNNIMLIPDRYKGAYIYYVVAMIDFSDGETARYSNSAAMYNSIMNEYQDWYQKNNKKKNVQIRRI